MATIGRSARQLLMQRLSIFRHASFVMALLLVHNGTAQLLNETLVATGDPVYIIKGCRLSDGGYVLCGRNTSTAALDLLRLTPDGVVIWAQELQAPLGQGVYDVSGILQSANGDFCVLASTDASALIPEHLLARFDLNGIPIWMQKLTYATSVTIDAGNGSGDIEEMANGDLVVNVPSLNKPTLTRFTATGLPIWSTSFTTPDTVYTSHPSFDIEETDDGGILMCGIDVSHPFVIRTDTAGDLVWSRTYYPVYNFCLPQCLKVLPDGDILIAGNHDNATMMMRMSATGTIQWLKHYSVAPGAQWFDSMERSDDGTFFICSRDGAVVQHVDTGGNVLSVYNTYDPTNWAQLTCVSGAGGYAHMAGVLWFSQGAFWKPYLTRLNMDSVFACVFDPTTSTITDIPSVVGATGVQTMFASNEPVTVTPLTWAVTPRAWTGQFFCADPDALPALATAAISVSPTLVTAGGSVNVGLSRQTTVKADWYAANGAWVKRTIITGPDAVLSTTGFSPGLYTLRLSEGGKVLHSARVAMQ
jgi:hypothetical protein